MAFDNIGFRRKDREWAQHIAIQFTIITEKELRALGFYNNYKDIARHKKTMSELMLERNNDKVKAADSIIALNTDDYKILLERKMKTIQTAAVLDLPTVNDCVELIKNQGR